MTAPKSLLECLNVPEELKQYVSDYKINFIKIIKKWLTNTFLYSIICHVADER